MTTGDRVCAACSDNHCSSEPPADENYDVDDLAPEFIAKIKADCADFQKRFGKRIEAHERVSGQYTNQQMAGHDFLLTREGHGCGFWDGDWEEEFGRELTEACKKYGEVNMYVGDDGKLHGGG